MPNAMLADWSSQPALSTYTNTSYQHHLLTSAVPSLSIAPSVLSHLTLSSLPSVSTLPTVSSAPYESSVPSISTSPSTSSEPSTRPPTSKPTHPPSASTSKRPTNHPTIRSSAHPTERPFVPIPEEHCPETIKKGMWMGRLEFYHMPGKCLIISHMSSHSCSISHSQISHDNCLSV